jgi:hypothetical protein
MVVVLNLVSKLEAQDLGEVTFKLSGAVFCDPLKEHVNWPISAHPTSKTNRPMFEAAIAVCVPRRPASRCGSTSPLGPKERCDGEGEKCVSRAQRGLGRTAAGRKLPSFLPTSLAMSSFSKAFMRRMRALFFCGSRARLRVSFGSFFRSKS